jgi:cytochrome c6
MPKTYIFFRFFVFSIFVGIVSITKVEAVNLNTGKELFMENCAVCHFEGNNIIIPEKNLRKEALEENGMNTISAIMYQILNGKNGMPAFEGRLTEIQMEEIANYVVQESEINK